MQHWNPILRCSGTSEYRSSPSVGDNTACCVSARHLSDSAPFDGSLGGDGKGKHSGLPSPPLAALVAPLSSLPCVSPVLPFCVGASAENSTEAFARWAVSSNRKRRQGRHLAFSAVVRSQAIIIDATLVPTPRVVCSQAETRVPRYGSRDQNISMHPSSRGV